MPSASSQQKFPVLGDFCARNQSRTSGETWLYCPLSRASAGAQMKSTSSTTRNIFGLSNVGPCSVGGRSAENRDAEKRLCLHERLFSGAVHLAISVSAPAHNYKRSS